ncbi:MAG: hypothetical protein ACTS5A_03135, partial [Candidatus Hodgkinia cicadicola]
KPEVAEACTSGLRLAIYVISSSNKRRNNYLRLRCSVTICQRSLWVRWLRPPRRTRGREVNTGECYKWR